MEENRTTEELNKEEIKEQETVAEAQETKGEKKRSKKLEKEIEELKAQLAEKESALAAADDKYLRMLAEYDNFRRRSASEREKIYSDATSDALRGILPVLDNLERATAFGEADKVLEGLSMILKGFIETLKKMGVREIESLGKTFDPNVHNAVMHVEDENAGESEIVDVLQKGYICGDKVIRYAMVKVAN